jgi:DNA-binding response OmpR family regulator
VADGFVNKRVLIVEDDDDIREAICNVLQDEGFQPICARDGVEASAMLARVDVASLVLLDLWMPGMNGRDFATRMREDPRWSSVPIVVLSADRHLDEIAQSIGARACLPKPFAIEAFLSIVEENVR